MEKRSARSVRAALEAMSMEDERKVHAAAQDEAAELVFRHKNPGAAFANPEAPYANPDRRGATGGGEGPRARAGSYQRWQRPEKAPIVEPRGMQRGSPSPSTDAPTIRKQASVDPQRTGSPPADATFTQGKRSLSGKSYGGLAEAVADDIQKAKRRTSSGSKRILSGEKKPYMHPNDRIWEDPQEEAAPKELPVVEESTKTRPAPTAVQPPSHVRKNPFARVRAQQDRLVHSNSAPSLPTAKHHSVEIQKNPPSRSRNAWYTSNEPLPPTPPPSSGQPGDEVEPKGTSPTRDGQEIRGDDIRAATSKQRKDRSANLPQPTMVSDKPGRPIVSFQTQVWEKVLEEVQTRALEPSQMDGARAQSPLRQPLASPYGRGKSPAPDSRPPIPSIVIPDEPKGRQRGGMPPIPTINLPDGPSMPTVVLPEEPGFAETSQQSAPGTPTTASVSPISINAPDWTPPSIHRPGQRPLPTPTSKHTRPLAHHSATSPLPKSSPHYTPTIRHSSALCAHCALPITGRILSAAGARFHPGCFVCHTCHTNLELVAFYPEPQNHHQNRLARLHHTTNDPSSHHHPDLNNNDPDPDIDIDNDPAQRFYCHLDFHEHFSPRCKTCQTPIEGQAIVACGAEYHEGHFFCAQCGDPFDASTPFVEKDNYAWCVGCHTNRYSEKCRKCRKPVTELVVKALGWDWHEECFVCLVSLFLFFFSLFLKKGSYSSLTVRVGLG